MGASIIQWWPLPLHNAGVAGQTTSQMLARFRTDVLGHGYVRVIILGGSNDVILKVADPPSEISANLQSMALIAKAAGMEVVLSALTPITWNGSDLNTTVAPVNTAIRQLAADQGYLFIDNFSPMQGHPEYFTDGLHPSASGYSVMERSLAAVVTR